MPSSLAVFHLGALGDLLVALPAIRLLRRALGPRTRVRALVSGAAKAALLVRCGAAHEAGDLSSAAWTPLFAGSAGALPRLAPGTVAAVLLREGEAVAAALRALGAHRVMTLSPRPVPEARTHAVDHLLEKARRVTGLPAGPRARAPRLAVPADERAEARAALASLGVEAGRGLLLHPGSGGAKKMWPLERFLEVAREARGRLGRAPAFVLGPVEADAHPALGAAIEASGHPLLREPSLPRLAALSHEAGLFLGNDGGPAHLAAAAGATTLALFGPSSAAVWAPRGRLAEALLAPGGDLGALGAEEVLARLGALGGGAA